MIKKTIVMPVLFPKDLLKATFPETATIKFQTILCSGG